MGRLALLTLTALGLAGCASEEAERALGHETLACAACHQGGSADRDIASVPSATCADSDCHGSDGPSSTVLQRVSFDHRDHGPTAPFAVGCAGCHRHAEGSAPLEAGAATCGLCHQEELAGPRAEQCRVCHVDLSYQGVTPQGLVIPHEDFSSIGRGCLRCHFEVAEPVQETSIERCGSCHDDIAEIQRRGIGVDLHPTHAGVSCASCHETDTHHIESMSSSVALECSDCHTAEHEVELLSHWLTSGTCLNCHGETHQAPQALLLGVQSAGDRPRPAEHFTAGLTCASCHVDGSGSEAAPGEVTVQACSSCHQAEYETVGLWWIEGVRDRFAVVAPYVEEAARIAERLPHDHPSRERLEVTQARLDLVSMGGGHHNIRLTHQIFEDAVEAAAGVLESAGFIPRPPPALGRAPTSGFCSYCHYHVDPTHISEEMPEDFHRDVMR